MRHMNAFLQCQLSLMRCTIGCSIHNNFPKLNRYRTDDIDQKIFEDKNTNQDIRLQLHAAFGYHKKNFKNFLSCKYNIKTSSKNRILFKFYYNLLMKRDEFSMNLNLKKILLLVLFLTCYMLCVVHRLWAYTARKIFCYCFTTCLFQ